MSDGHPILTLSSSDFKDGRTPFYVCIDDPRGVVAVNHRGTLRDALRGAEEVRFGSSDAGPRLLIARFRPGTAEESRLATVGVRTALENLGYRFVLQTLDAPFDAREYAIASRLDGA